MTLHEQIEQLLTEMRELVSAGSEDILRINAIQREINTINGEITARHHPLDTFTLQYKTPQMKYWTPWAKTVTEELIQHKKERLLNYTPQGKKPEWIVIRILRTNLSEDELVVEIIDKEHKYSL